MYLSLKKSIKEKKAIISVVGLGYVGLPLIIEFAKHFKTIGYDKNNKKILNLKNKKDINNIIENKNLQKTKINFTNNLQDLKKSHIIVIALPTPVTNNHLPNLKIIFQSLKDIIKINLKNKLIILESTVYPGASQEFINFLEKKTDYKINNDFYFGYSPERINPGDKKNTLKTIAKIVSGSNHNAKNLVKLIYKKIIKKIYVAKNIEYAEMAKVIENCQRDINIAFINEVALICDKLKLNSSEVINLASTKWNFMKFKPGLVGGHCIGVDPYYLAYKAKKIGYNPKIILSGRKLNEYMPVFVTKKINKITENKKNKILIMGLSYKKDSNDFRNSKSIDLYKMLSKKHDVSVYDPYLRKEIVKELKIKNHKINLKNNNYDLIVISVDHSEFKKIGLKKIKKVGKKNVKIFDLKNLFPNNNHLYL